MRYHEIMRLNEAIDTDSAAFKTWFAGSKVVDYFGRPQMMHHGAIHWDEPIEEFRPLTHFGSTKAANKRVKDQMGRGVYSTMNMAVYPVYLAIRKPLRIGDARGVQHTISNILKYLAFGTYALDVKSPVLLNKRHGQISIDGYEQTRKSSDPKAAMITLLTAKGYDGLVYKNSVEDAGNDSWVIFRPDQVRNAYADLTPP
jgi:hypothetical protein